MASTREDSDEAAATVPPAAARRRRDARWRLLVLAMAAILVNEFSRIGMPVAGDLRIMERYGIAPDSMGLIYSAFLLGYTLFMTPGGLLIDRIGPRRAITLMGLSTALFAALTGGVGLAFAAGGAFWWSLAVVRFLMGVCSAPLFPATAAFARSWFPPGQRAFANGLIGGAAPLGVALAYPAFGAAVRRLDWPGAFFLVAAATAVLTLIWALAATDHPDDSHLAGAPGGDGECIEAAGGWRAALGDRGLLLVTASYAAAGYFDFLFFYWMNHYFRSVLKLGDADWYASLPPLAMTVGIPLGGWLSDRLSRSYGPAARNWVVAGGMVVSAACLIPGVLSSSPAAIVAWFSLALGAIGISESTFWIVAMERGGRYRGTAAALMNTAGNVGGMIAPALTPWIGVRYGWSPALALGGLIGLLGATCWLFIPVDEERAGP
ncbi:MFS transporter [Aquisphaera insulae]|uniref:MFS transporter n=1 Tax=Aquisphaera insulae TaxID=2712864 RepID=UPI0013EB8F8E|nr:MFS transporter [Aquisphaera insulae]